MNPVTLPFRYTFDSENELLKAAARIMEQRIDCWLERKTLQASAKVKEYLACEMRHLEREEFVMLCLDNQHKLIAKETLSIGTIDCANVYPREAVKVCLRNNAAAVIFAHNHPSGVSEPSAADRHITQRLNEAMRLIDVRVLDHIVVGFDKIESFAERGWI